MKDSTSDVEVESDLLKRNWKCTKNAKELEYLF